MSLTSIDGLALPDEPCSLTSLRISAALVVLDLTPKKSSGSAVEAAAAAAEGRVTCHPDADADVVVVEVDDDDDDAPFKDAALLVAMAPPVGRDTVHPSTMTL